MAVLIGNNANNNIVGTPFVDDIFGRGGNDVLSGRAGDDNLFGEEGSDILFGEGGVDFLFGVNPFGVNPGRGEVDQLIGGTQGDVFFLSATVNGVNTVFYNDGNPNTNGTNDFGLIRDFNTASDSLALAPGFAYATGASPIAGLPGTGVFVLGFGVPELIGIIQFDNTVASFTQGEVASLEQLNVTYDAVV